MTRSAPHPYADHHYTPDKAIHLPAYLRDDKPKAVTARAGFYFKSVTCHKTWLEANIPAFLSNSTTP